MFKTSNTPLINGDAGPIIATETVKVIAAVQVQLQIALVSGGLHVPGVSAQGVLDGNHLRCRVNAWVRQQFHFPNFGRVVKDDSGGCVPVEAVVAVQELVGRHGVSGVKISDQLFR